jgi:hypothetical protein
MDKGYDNNRVMAETRERGCVPIVCLRKGRPVPLDKIPYGSDEWKRLYRGRAAVEREFGRLKNEYGLTPLRTRGLDRVGLRADLVMIARLGQALARARAVPLAAYAARPLVSPAAPATLDVPAVVLGFPCGPGCAWPGSSAVDPVEESRDLPVQRPEHLALRLSMCVEIAKAS